MSIEYWFGVFFGVLGTGVVWATWHLSDRKPEPCRATPNCSFTEGACPHHGLTASEAESATAPVSDWDPFDRPAAEDRGEP